ncbi:hypothetical protein L596_007232 [Steinernema carpocapsae]|uniref:Cytochrome b561 domain-containing protein n=1 Tax=Steinernema carpocapsae TaxID=34508 RepID=A0A4U5P919_STECR|nr:hypothetical protein L596_007232 [Steinernema carpocapsae]
MESLNTTDLLSNLTTPSSALLWKKNLPTVYGSTFIFAWYVFVPVAAFAARYFRDFLTQCSPFGARLWFHVHHSLNILTAVLIIVGLLSTNLPRLGLDWTCDRF